MNPLIQMGVIGLFWQGVDYRMQMRFLGDFEGDILYQGRLWSGIQLSLVFFLENIDPNNKI